MTGSQEQSWVPQGYRENTKIMVAGLKELVSGVLARSMFLLSSLTGGRKQRVCTKAWAGKGAGNTWWEEGSPGGRGRASSSAGGKDPQ